MIMDPIHLMRQILLRHNQTKTLLMRRPVRRILWTYRFSWEVLFPYTGIFYTNENYEDGTHRYEIC